MTQPKTKTAARRKADAELDEITAKAVREAHHFTCTILSNSRYRTLRHETLAGARALKPEMEADAANGRKAMIYAVTHAEMTFFIPDDFIDPAI